jgi:hypothetical protein
MAPEERQKQRDYRASLSPEKREKLRASARESMRRRRQNGLVKARDAVQARGYRSRLKSEGRLSVYYKTANLKKYGLTIRDYEALVVKQGGRCANALCSVQEPGGKWNRWAVDHDHKTGKVRGLLCNGCNIALGHARDSVDVLRGLTAYLEAQNG